MANLVTSTEALGDTGVWTTSDVTVTANTHGAPAFAGDNATAADTVADNSAGAQGNLIGTYYPTTFSVDYVASVFVRKDANTSRWPEFVLQFSAGPIGYVSINTSTGDTADGTTPPAARGVVDVDATWWRLWWRVANNGSGTDARVFMFPDHLDGLGGGTTSAGTGSVVLWGFNITQSSSVQTYEPHPFYAFVTNDAKIIFRGV